MVRICAIGDPHGNLSKIRKVPKNPDFYLITGDLGKADLARKISFENFKRRKQNLPEIKNNLKTNKKIHDEIHFSTISVLTNLAKFAPTYTIQGNMGIATIRQAKRRTIKEGFENIPTRKIINETKDMNIVKNVVRNLGGLRVGFLEYFVDTCWVRYFKPSDYKKSMNNAKKQSDKARKVLKSFGKVNILVCHQPPYGILDRVNFPGVPSEWRGKHAGSKIILDYIKKYQPSYVFCGHIHEGEGKTKIGNSEVFNLGAGGFKVIEF